MPANKSDGIGPVIVLQFRHVFANNSYVGAPFSPENNPDGIAVLKPVLRKVPLNIRETGAPVTPLNNVDGMGPVKFDAPRNVSKKRG